jgi:fatty acid desaturase
MNDVTHDDDRQSARIRWYRTPIEKELFRELSQRSDLLGGLQTGAYVALYVLTATASLYGAIHWPWFWVLGVVFVHGTITAFSENAMHEFTHNTVFRTNALNALFVRVISFLGWLNFVTFNASHTRHHAYTLYPPYDQEVVLPMRLTLRDFLRQGFFDPVRLYTVLRDTTRIARGRIEGQWELISLPESDAHRRQAAVCWARVLLLGHGFVAIVSLWRGWWMVPVVITLAPFYGGCLFWLCNNTQHIGMQDNVADFRLNSRTFKLNPFVRLLYWHMNYHIEHHMYPAVPCYRLNRLHRALVHDLPCCPIGIAATWREIASILERQRVDPAYRHVPAFPEGHCPKAL